MLSLIKTVMVGNALDFWHYIIVTSPAPISVDSGLWWKIGSVTALSRRHFSSFPYNNTGAP